MKKINFIKTLSILSVLFFALMNTACEDNLDGIVVNDNVLTLKVSAAEMVLDQKKSNENLTFNWTTGTNYGSSSAISYVLHIDKQGNNFANALEYQMGTNNFTFSINAASLNFILLNTFGIKAGVSQKFEARLTATIAESTTAPQISVVAFSLTPYQPVSTTLFMLGSATSAGLNILNAIEMTPSATSIGTFVYQGTLTTGSFKLPINRDNCLCQDFYTKNSNNTGLIIHNLNGSGDDLQWQITQAGQYKVTVNLLDLTISIEAVIAPPFSHIWIVGDASPSGWNIDTPKEFAQSSDNPYLFIYEANFTSGDFKILAGTTGNWCGEWYRPLVNGQALTLTAVAQNSGCTVDNKWTITPTDVGRYKIILNTSSNTISIQKVNLYIVGDGGPNGWNIATPTSMTYSNGNFTYNGLLGADNATGEFKISKFAGSWCDGDWINAATANQPISKTNFITTHGCDGPDNKWKLKTGDAGTHAISINLDTQVMTIN